MKTYTQPAACLIGLLIAMGMFSAQANSLKVVGNPGSETTRLIGPRSSQQLIVIGEFDLTRDVTFTMQPVGIVRVDEAGLVTPLRDGATTVTATHGNQTAATKIEVSRFSEKVPLSFPNDILPVITRNHCNAGACHAKSHAINGFTLSLFGYDPKADYETLVKDSRGRRVSVTSPVSSLILQKASGTLPHSGGARLDSSTTDYQTLRAWIKGGADYGPPNDPEVTRIEIFPKSIVVNPGGKQQLSVTAFFDNETSRDITRLTQFAPNQPEMVEVSETGLVTFNEKTGTTSIMVRFQEHVDVFRATIPLNKTRPVQPKSNNYIDDEIFRQLSLLGIPASDLASDHEFLRRVTLDIAGRIPTLDESKTFLASKDPDKRSKRIDELVQTTDYANFFAGKWAGILRNKANPNLDWVSRETFAFHSWISQSFLENKPFDQFASELVTASGKASDNPAVGWYRSVTDPKERMQDIAQVFLGIRMQCAQCHHHPYERWSQDDYYGFTAFFSTIKRKAVYRLPEDDIVYHDRKPAQFENPVTKTKMKPTVPGGMPCEIAPERDPRFALAEWIRSRDNPYFARVVVNRYWKHFFGRGLVEPEDDIRPTNPPTHPELLERLSREFVADNFDVASLIKTICNSRTYQLSSQPKGSNSEDTQNYARFYPRRMQAEVLLDSFNDISGAQNSFNKQPVGVRAVALPDDSSNKESQFLTIFGRPQMDTACECERTPEANLGQSLHLINSDIIQKKLGDNNGRANQFAREENKSLDELMKDLYLIAYCREPNPNELEIAKRHLEKKMKAAKPEPADQVTAKRTGFEDLIWVLANTKEFLFNH